MLNPTLATTRLLVLVGSVLLVFGGLALIFFGVRFKREGIAQRIDLVHSGRVRGQDALPSEKAGPDILLTRPELPGVSEPLRREAARWLAKLKVPPQHAVSVFTGLRLLVAAGAAGAGLLAADHVAVLRATGTLPFLMAFAAGITGWFAAILILRTLAKRRSKAVAEGFPDALELLVVCVEAGLALEDGIDKITGELQRSQPSLAEELALTAAELKILPNRDQALTNLAERVNIASVRSVVATLSQSMRYGTPLAQAMRTVAAQMRSEALIQLQERANRLPALMTVPMMLFIMPALFLIVAGPAVLRLLDILSR
jgi:tight adherence protein C